MNGNYKKCVVCGKMYKYCSYCENDRTAFHWRRKACSPECAKKYLIAVGAIKPEPQPAETSGEPAVQAAEATAKNPVKRGKPKAKAESLAQDAQ